jgi:hypothetical protein
MEYVSTKTGLILKYNSEDLKIDEVKKVWCIRHAILLNQSNISTNVSNVEIKLNEISATWNDRNDDEYEWGED